jgi:TSS9, PorZ, N-terminal beta-propeller domain/Two component regulator propeller
MYRIALKEFIVTPCLLLFLFVDTLFSQTDFSDNWEDFYSYNNVKDFVKIDERIYAITDNAAFIYDINSNESDKISSVHGLSGKVTSSIFYSVSTKRFVIGYQSGLIEIIDEKGKITIANDIERLDITGQKQINHIAEFDEILYLSTPFGIVQYDINQLNFGDTYFIDENSNPVFVNQTAIFQNTIYAATEKGIYSADINDPNLIDFNNWLQPEGSLLGDFLSLSIFNNEIYTSRANILYKLTSFINLQQIGTYPQTIISIRSSAEFLTIATKNRAFVLNTSLLQVFEAIPDEEFNFSLQNAVTEDQNVYLATTAFGILQNSFSNIAYQEIHPKGPSSNQVFSIAAENDNLWVVYGGYNGAFTPLGRRLGYSHYNGVLPIDEQWINFPYDPAFPALDLVHITLDPQEENKAYISSWNSGILVVENDNPIVLWDESNSGLESLILAGSPDFTSIRINGSAFDNLGNFWVANAWINERVKKLNTNGNWDSFDLSSIMTNQALGLTELVIDKTGSIWIGSRRNGALVYNESGDRKRALITEATKGSLPDLNVRTLVVDRNNRIWIGTQKGLVVFSDAEGIFEASLYDAEPVIIEDDGIPKKLLGDQPINTIAIDGAENKWFGTDTGGVLGTNPSGNETLFNFNKDNSPLPSNRILKIKVDDSTGKVFFATEKGIVAFNNNVAPFGETLGEVYAYPNPSRKENDIITIDGRRGTHLPRGTNVKILDTAGRLVHETNVEVGQEIKGGKVIWNKTNLAGRKVASGIYIVLLTSPDKTETSSTKIAIIN